jgi:hypothetical protein
MCVGMAEHITFSAHHWQRAKVTGFSTSQGKSERTNIRRCCLLSSLFIRKFLAQQTRYQSRCGCDAPGLLSPFDTSWLRFLARLFLSRIYAFLLATCGKTVQTGRTTWPQYCGCFLPAAVDGNRSPLRLGRGAVRTLSYAHATALLFPALTLLRAWDRFPGSNRTSGKGLQVFTLSSLSATLEMLRWRT